MIAQVNGVNVRVVGLDDFVVDHDEFFQTFVQLVAAKDDVQTAAQFDMPDEARVEGEAGDIKMARGEPRRDVFVILQRSRPALAV